MNRLTKIIKILFKKEIYAIGYRINSDNDEFKIHSEIPYQIIPPEKNEWYADPFLFSYNNEIYLFAEVMNYSDGKGSIGVLNLNKEKKFKTALSEPFHLSYPNVFKYKNEIYMIPETCFSNQLRLYKSSQFPNKWELEWIMLDGVKYVDTSVFILNDKIYLETQDKVLNGNKCFKIDIGKKGIEEINLTHKKYINRRCGGNFFETKSGIYHALQNCDEEYGQYLHIGKIESFDDYGISETEVSTLKVSDIQTADKKKYERVHTFNKCGDIEVIDLLYTKLDLINLLPKFIHSLKHKFGL